MKDVQSQHSLKIADVCEIEGGVFEGGWQNF
jgi:hypothetical protein